MFEELRLRKVSGRVHDGGVADGVSLVQTNSLVKEEVDDGLEAARWNETGLDDTMAVSSC